MQLKFILTAWLLLLSFASSAEIGDVVPTAKPTQQGAKLDLGIGLGYSQIPHYIGSSQNHHYTVPYPYVYYRSEHFTLDRRALIASIWQQGAWSLDWSASADFALDSDENAVRQGMPDLAWVAQIGPALKYHYAIGDSGQQHLTTVFALRQAVAIDGFSFDHAGFLFEPGIVYQHSFKWLSHQWRLSAQAQLVFADREYMGYYYDVAAPYATANRAEFSAQAGFQSTRLSLGLTFRHHDWWFGGFTRYYNVSGSNIKQSPLVTDQHNLLVGIAVTRIFSIF